MERPLAIFDLDETVIFCTKEPLSWPHARMNCTYYLHRRPGLQDFLAQVAASYDVAVWSAASPNYVTEIVDNEFRPIVEPVFAWNAYRCTLRRDCEIDEWIYAKPLYKVKRRGFDLRRVLIIEDDPLKVRQNYGNAIYVKPFQGDPADQELPRLANYLSKIAGEPDFRRMEKRTWRSS